MRRKQRRVPSSDANERLLVFFPHRENLLFTLRIGGSSDVEASRRVPVRRRQKSSTTCVMWPRENGLAAPESCARPMAGGRRVSKRDLPWPGCMAAKSN